MSDDHVTVLELWHIGPDGKPDHHEVRAMSDEKTPHGLGMWQRRFVSRDELLKEYPMSDGKRCEHGYPIGGLCQLCRGLQRAVDAGYLSPENGPQPMSDEKPIPDRWWWDSDRCVLSAINRHYGEGYPPQGHLLVLAICEEHGVSPEPDAAALIADAWQLPQLRELLDELAGIAEQAAQMLNVVGITGPDGPVGRARALLDKHGRT